jgi:hypothetical protein
MTPTSPPMVQRLEVEKRTAVTPLASVIRHYAPKS